MWPLRPPASSEHRIWNEDATVASIPFYPILSIEIGIECAMLKNRIDWVALKDGSVIREFEKISKSASGLDLS